MRSVKSQSAPSSTPRALDQAKIATARTPYIQSKRVREEKQKKRRKNWWRSGVSFQLSNDISNCRSPSIPSLAVRLFILGFVRSGAFGRRGEREWRNLCRARAKLGRRHLTFVQANIIRNLDTGYASAIEEIRNPDPQTTDGRRWRGRGPRQR